MMNTEKYRYVSPSEQGCTLVRRIPKKVRKTLLPHRKVGILHKQEWWINDSYVEIHYLASIWGKILLTILFPVQGLIVGFFNKELYKGYKRMYFQKKYGSFSSDRVYRSGNSEFYNTVVEYRSVSE